MPWIVTLGFAVAIGLVALLNFHFIRNLWHRIQRGDQGMDDEWDPFS